MSPLEWIIIGALIVLFIIESFSYKGYSEKVKLFEAAVKTFDDRCETYEKSYNDYAEGLITMSSVQKNLAERQGEMIQHLTEIETLISIHSEALNTKLLFDIIKSRLTELTNEQEQ